MCCWCGDEEKELHVHHLEYKRDNKVWDYPDDNFLTLCKTCHKEVTEILTDVKRKLWSCRYAYALKNLSKVWKTEKGKQSIVKLLQKMANASED